MFQELLNEKGQFDAKLAALENKLQNLTPVSLLEEWESATTRLKDLRSHVENAQQGITAKLLDLEKAAELMEEFDTSAQDVLSLIQELCSEIGAERESDFVTDIPKQKERMKVRDKEYILSQFCWCI